MFDWIVSGFRFLLVMWLGILFLFLMWLGWCLWFRRGIRAAPIPPPVPDPIPKPIAEPIAEAEPPAPSIASEEAVSAVREPSQLTSTVQLEQESLALPAPPAAPMASPLPAPLTPAVPAEPSLALPVPPMPSVPVLRAEDLPPDTLCELSDGTVVTLAVVEAWRKLQLRWLAIPQEQR